MVSYELDGEQYLAVAVRTAVWTFKLGGKQEQEAAPAFAGGVAFARIRDLRRGHSAGLSLRHLDRQPVGAGTALRCVCV